MIFREMPIGGTWLISGDRHVDDRGTFARIWAASEFAERGLAERPVETSVSANSRRLTLRGLHYQAEPHSETKLVTCISGAVWDVVVDLRPESSTHLHWHGVELNGSDAQTVYIPAGCAHGYLTLTADAILLYQIASPYTPDAGQGIRWDDPAFAIAWPELPQVISERDRGYADYVPTRGGRRATGEAQRR